MAPHSRSTSAATTTAGLQDQVPWSTRARGYKERLPYTPCPRMLQLCSRIQDGCLGTRQSAHMRLETMLPCFHPSWNLLNRHQQGRSSHAMHAQIQQFTAEVWAGRQAGLCVSTRRFLAGRQASQQE